MAITIPLCLLTWAFLLKCASITSLSSDQRSGLGVECGPTAGRAANFTIPASSARLAYTRVGPHQHQCRSRLQMRGPISVHLITHLFKPHCGAKVSADGRHFTITVHVQHSAAEKGKPQETIYTVSCQYDANFHILHSHVEQQSSTQEQPPTSAAKKSEENKIHVHGFRAHLYPKHYASRLVNDMDERVLVSVEKDFDQPSRRLAKEHSYFDPSRGFKKKITQLPLALSKQHGPPDVSGMTSSSSSVVQLNVVDVDGSMTTVVYPEKQVALELHSGHHNSLGVPVVTSCKALDPLQQSSGHNVAIPPFSVSILQHGCGTGDSLPQSSSFVKGRQGFITPYFSVPPSWTKQPALLFSCDVIICADVRRCWQNCPPQRRQPLTPGLHDITILLDSQVVTSCPSADDVDTPGDVRWGDSLPRECLPEGHRLHQPLTPSDIEPEQNITAGAAGSDVNKGIPPSSWLAGNLHYIIIIALLVLLIIIFMMATFCKMVAVQRHIRRSHKATAREVRERTENEHQDQMTQTPRPLPRTPNTRSHTPNRHSRQGGDGASVTVLHLDDGHVPAIRPSSGPPVLPFDNRRDSLHPPLAAAHQRNSGPPRPQPYDVPPSHEQQQECRASVSSEPRQEFRASISSEPRQEYRASISSEPRQEFRASVSSEPRPDFRSSVSSEPAQTPFVFETPQRSSKVQSYQTSTTVEEKNSERHTTIIEIKNPGQRDPVENGLAWKGPDHLASFTGGASSSGNNTLERGVVLGVNSLRRHLDRENQHVASQPRDRRPITAQQQEALSVAQSATPQMYYNTPALCSEDSSLKELMLTSAPAAPTSLGGIRTSPHRGSRKGGAMPVVINTMEETTRL